ncbi:Aromatic ring-opening dioxygenase, catalytic subunit, LigB family [Clostridium cavendishii DSM 21758]|uniref:Aromatic ring-opening dioxygenase, catalytic subunit, LigB family n=1 Tax=Clostridium cavendishii DSM 21758 TaxID=1121302 RepID=A0A1M6TFJ4_9CLOT|nr:4,5-DOPA dioxygenase extradiol [Clostridium cavendishii]SHK55644.1 Aromatic ring-opening dioxygenase, catalytic subunit, LigB family [Clostridium cavendishii DSM 21758]
MVKRLPALFIAHGSPMNIALENEYTEALKKLGHSIETPKAILVISAHWRTNGAGINISDTPKQIYDFYGFPDELYNIKYEVTGSRKYALEALEEVKDLGVLATESWGLDHGAWGILKHIYPKADIPVFQLSLNALEDENYHYKLGKKLSELRDKGFLIIGSGNIVHSFRYMDYDMDAEPQDFAVKFEEYIKDALLNDDHKKLINYKDSGELALKSVPTDEHYVPLLYIAGLKQKNEKITFIYEGIQNASMSMTSFMIS